MKDAALAFLQKRNPKVCVLATASKDGQTEAAFVGFAIKEDLIFIVNTEQKSRKFKNIQQNPHVSLVIGWGFSENNVQIDGKARVIENQEEQATESFFYEQNPDAKQFKTPTTMFIEIKPTWMRVIDISTHPPKILEENL